MRTSIALYTEAEIPLVGYCVSQHEIISNEVQKSVDGALQIGYRHLDIGPEYESAVGDVLQRWISVGNLQRGDVFITIKLPSSSVHPNLVSDCLQKSLQKLKLDYVDMYLIDAPIYAPAGFEKNPSAVSTDLIGTWKAMEAEVDAGKTKAIGLSMFNESQIERVRSHARIQPANLKVELHVYLQEKSLVDYCQKNGIVVTSRASLGGKRAYQQLFPNDDSAAFSDPLEHELIIRKANQYNKTPGQICLKYLIQKNIVVIPDTHSEERLKQNLQIFDFSLTTDEMDEISRLDKGENGRVFRLSKFVSGIAEHPEYPHAY